MRLPSQYLIKLFLITAILYGLLFSCIMALVETDDFSFNKLFFHFSFFGILMASFDILIKKRSLKKEGVNTLDKVTMDENQVRRIITYQSKDEFYNFWNNSEKYKVVQNKDGSLNVNRRNYTSNLKATINVSYQEKPEPMMILQNQPNKWLYNDLALIHRTIDSLKEYILKEVGENPQN